MTYGEERLAAASAEIAATGGEVSYDCADTGMCLPGDGLPEADSLEPTDMIARQPGSVPLSPGQPRNPVVARDVIAQYNAALANWALVKRTRKLCQVFAQYFSSKVCGMN